MTRRTRILHLAGATAPRALDIELHPSAHLRHLPRAMALRTLNASARSRLTFASRANLLPLNLQLRHSTPHRSPEVHCDLVLKISSRLRPAGSFPAGPRKHLTEDVFKAAKTSTRLLLSSTRLKVRKIKPAKVERNLLRAPTTPCAARKSTIPATSRSLRRRRVDVVRVEAELIIDLPLLLIAQNIVCLGDLLELLLSLLVSRIHIRVILARKFAKRFANLLRRRRLLDPKYPVIIFRLCRHSLLPFCNRRGSSAPEKPPSHSAWQVGHQKKFRPTISFFSTVVPYTKQGRPFLLYT